MCFASSSSATCCSAWLIPWKVIKVTPSVMPNKPSTRIKTPATRIAVRGIAWGIGSGAKEPQAKRVRYGCRLFTACRKPRCNRVGYADAKGNCPDTKTKIINPEIDWFGAAADHEVNASALGSRGNRVDGKAGRAQTVTGRVTPQRPRFEAQGLRSALGNFELSAFRLCLRILEAGVSERVAYLGDDL